MQILPTETATQISPHQTSNKTPNETSHETRDAAGNAIRAKLHGLVAGVLGARMPASPLGDEDSLAEAGVASIDMVTLLLSLEREFDFEVPQHDITPETFRSIATLDALVRRCRSDTARA